ncbi:MAG: glutamate--tRNA ligase [Bacteroidia bacterium]
MEMIVRFAPSPTGGLHIGGVRTALYNYLLVKKYGGKLILRIEDTDQQRFVEGAEQYIIDALAWCGIVFDEGPHIEGGKVGPYRQSERKAIYQQYTQELIEKGFVYYAFDTPEELEAMRQKMEAEKQPQAQYNAISRQYMKNSLTLSKEEVQQRISAGEAYVVRIKMPENQEITFYDEVRGQVTVNTTTLDDKVMMKADGLPTYHLANIVDDHLMGINLVIRGEEWLPSAPAHIYLYQCLGWDLPKFAHLPLILRKDGNGKLSKRAGDTVFPLTWKDAEGFKEKGYLPEALINFLAFVGWNPGTEQEIMTIDEMAQFFSLEKIGKSGARFDETKLEWFNKTYLQHKPFAEIALQLEAALQKAGFQENEFSPEYQEKAFSLMKERISFVKQVVENGYYLFDTPASYDVPFIVKKWTEVGKENVQKIANLWEETPESDWNHHALHENFQTYIKENGIKNGEVLPQLRLVLTGASGGPSVFEIAELIGKSESVIRIKENISQIEKLKAEN